MATKNISSKFKDIISKSVLIQSGSPAVYQLKPNKENFGSLRRMTLGEKDLNKTNRTILLVGETGTGKSTLVNALVNYTMGVKWEDDVWFQIVEDENRSQSKSQTSDEKNEDGPSKSQTTQEQNEDGQSKSQTSDEKNEDDPSKSRTSQEESEDGQCDHQTPHEKNKDGPSKSQTSHEENEDGPSKSQTTQEESEDGQSENQTSDEKNEDGQSVSQTSDVIVYQIFGFEDQTLPYSLTVIDTPGYGDTRGIEHDDIISERLLDLFSSVDGVHEINAVGLVMKATDNRLSDRLMYIFDSVVSLFGKNMEKKIVALITHSDGVTPENALKALEVAKIKCAKDEENETIHFLFNNCQSEERTEENKVVLKHAWDLTTGEINNFTDFLKNVSPQKLMTTIEVLNSRIRLKACIQNLKERIKFTEDKQREIHQTEEEMKKHEEEMKNNENFTVEVEEVYKERETISGGRRWLIFYEGAVCCTVCEENCHYPGCTVAWYPSHCEVMKDGRCTSCTGKCPVSDHVKEQWKYENKTRKVQKTLQDVKEKFEKSKSDCEETTSHLGNLKEKMKELQKDKDKMLDESFDHVVKLEQIALNVDSVSTLVHLDFLIEKMKEKGDTEKVQKLEEMKRRVEKNKGVLSALQYGINRLTAAGRSMMK